MKTENNTSAAETVTRLYNLITEVKNHELGNTQ